MNTTDDNLSSVTHLGKDSLFQNVQLAIEKQKADKIKLEIKKQLKQFDTQNTGLIKVETFFDTLKEKNIRLNVKDVKRLKALCG